MRISTVIDSQKGYTVVGMFTLLALLIFSIYLVLRVSVIYYDAFVISKEVEHLTDPSFSYRSEEGIKTYLRRQLEINGVDSVAVENIQVNYNSEEKVYDVNVRAEERARIVHKLFFLIQIDESVKVPQ